MKNIFAILLFLCTSVVNATNYYVAPSGGSDSNAGTIVSPWSTFQKAFDVANAGDTVFFRNGIWYNTTTATLDPTLSHGHTGTHSAPICFFNYPGESVIIDGTNWSSGTIGILIDHTSYIKFRGITIRNIPQTDAGQTILGWNPNNGGNYYFDLCVSHGNGGHGWQAMGYDTLVYINCDSYDNYDQLTDGNTADGFAGGSGGTVNDTLKYTYWYGCRAWHNSDDGFDMGTTKQTYTINCWSFLNGYPLDSPTAEGDGIKCGPSHTRMPSKRLVQNCISAFNKGAAFSHNNMREEFNGPVMKWENNVGYKCGTGWFFPYSDSEPPFDPALGGGNIVMTNNIVYDMNDYWAIPFLWGTNLNYVHQTTNNSSMTLDWPYESVNITTTNADFITVDSTTAVTQMRGARKADGSLPDITAFHLVSGSDLIGAGTNVGMSITPDLGIDWNYLDGATTSVRFIKEGGKFVKIGNKFVK